MGESITPNKALQFGIILGIMQMKSFRIINFEF